MAAKFERKICGLIVRFKNTLSRFLLVPESDLFRILDRFCHINHSDSGKQAIRFDEIHDLLMGDARQCKNISV